MSDLDAAIRNMRDAGHTWQEIADACGCARSTAVNRAKKIGAHSPGNPGRPPGFRLSEETKRLISESLRATLADPVHKERMREVGRAVASRLGRAPIPPEHAKYFRKMRRCGVPWAAARAEIERMRA